MYCIVCLGMNHYPACSEQNPSNSFTTNSMCFCPKTYALEKLSCQYADEEVKETPSRDSITCVKAEPADHSGASTPSSPITPQDDSDLKPVLSTANSTTDQERLPTDGNAVAVSGSDGVCTSTTDSTQFGKDLSNSLSECLVEINVSIGSGRNTPSPCPSTAGICPVNSCISYLNLEGAFLAVFVWVYPRNLLISAH